MFGKKTMKEVISGFAADAKKVQDANRKVAAEALADLKEAQAKLDAADAEIAAAGNFIASLEAMAKGPVAK